MGACLTRLARLVPSAGDGVLVEDFPLATRLSGRADGRGRISDRDGRPLWVDGQGSRMGRQPRQMC